MPQCLQCWRDDVGSFQSKCYMENKWNIMKSKSLSFFFCISRELLVFILFERFFNQRFPINALITCNSTLSYMYEQQYLQNPKRKTVFLLFYIYILKITPFYLFSLLKNSIPDEVMSSFFIKFKIFCKTKYLKFFLYKHW